jgi:hypothetical protein
MLLLFGKRVGVAGRNRPARGVAQDVPFFTAARLERRAGALTEMEVNHSAESVRTIRPFIALL